MSGARSTKGCYTCRFRKKKCDETRPTCLSCGSRGITCYGYGAKPDWFKRSNEPGWDNEITQKLRCAAAKNEKARRSQYLRGNEENSIIKLTVALDHRSLTPKDRLWWDSGFKDNYNIHSSQETGLLVTYLEEIFPLQFGFYKLSPGTLGRGWFLNLISRSESLLHASTSLAECNRARKTIGGSMIEIQPSVDLQVLSTLTLQCVQKQVDLISQLSGIALLHAVIEAQAAVTQLMTQEFFKSIEGNWEIHFQASRTLFKTITKLNQPLESPYHQIPRTSSLLEIALSKGRMSENIESLEFFTTCFIWADILANATFGLKKPLSAQSFDYLPILQTGRLRLEDMMGCQNWAMLIIAEISNLEYRQTINPVSPETLNQICLGFEYRLQSGILRLFKSRPTLAASSLVHSNMVTEIFALAALVYLHTIIRGLTFDEQKVRDFSRMAVSAIKTLPPELIIRISLPFCILACMAEMEERPTYRTLLTKAEETRMDIGTAGRAVKIAEICWALRDSGDDRGRNMRTAMKSMGLRILLA